MPVGLADDPVPMLLVRAACALLFASAAWQKLRDRAAFSAILSAYRLLPDGLVRVAATTAGLAELAVALAWLAPGGGRAAVAATLALLAVYSAAIAVNLLRGRRSIDCGCGSRGERQPISEWLIVRNLGLALLALGTLRPVAPRALGWVDAVTLAGGLAVAAAVWTATHGLAAAAIRVRTAAGGAR